MTRPGRASGRLVLSLIAALGAVTSAQNPVQNPPQDQRPAFRSTTNVVRIDVYPRHRGQIVTGLTAADFRVTEDGQPQTIETFEYIPIADAASSEAPLEPRNAEEARRMAADPRNRVFVFYLDAYTVDLFGSARAREPLVGFMQRSMGPRDLFAVLFSTQSPELLEFTRDTQSLASRLNFTKPWGLYNAPPEDPEEIKLDACAPPGKVQPGPLVQLKRTLKVLNDLDGLVKLLGAMRPERKNLVLISDRWQHEIGLQQASVTVPTTAMAPPPAFGQRGRGSFQVPRQVTEAFDYCDRARRLLSGHDFLRMAKDLFERARRENVAVYFVPPAPATMKNFSLARSFADQTDGLSIVNNDIAFGLGQVLEHQTGFYMLGYRSTSTSEDRKLRDVRVRVTKSDVDLDVRRLYDPVPRAVTVAASSPPRERTPLERATDALARFRDDADVFIQPMARRDAVEVVLELASRVASRAEWRDGATVDALVVSAEGAEQGSASSSIVAGARSARLVIPIAGTTAASRVRIRLSRGDVSLSDDAPIGAAVGSGLGRGTLYRAGSLPRHPYLPAADLRFARTDRLRIEWPLDAPIDGPAVRLLSAAGTPLKADIVTSVVDGSPALLRADIRLLSLAAGDFIVEASGAIGGATVTQLTGIRVTR